MTDAAKAAPLVAVTIAAPADDTVGAQQFLVAAEARQIATPEDYIATTADLQKIKGEWKRIDDERKRLKGPLDEAVRRLQGFFAPPLNFLTKAEEVLKRKISAYLAEQERLRRIEQQRLDAAARKERERLEGRAGAAEASGKVEKAEMLQLQAAAVVAPVAQRAAPKVAGVSTTVVWKFEVVNASEVPREYCSVDETKIRKIVSALKGDTKIPGVRIYPDTQIRAGSAAAV